MQTPQQTRSLLRYAAFTPGPPSSVTSGGAGPEGSQEFALGPLHTLMQSFWKETKKKKTLWIGV